MPSEAVKLIPNQIVYETPYLTLTPKRPKLPTTTSYILQHPNPNRTPQQTTPLRLPQNPNLPITRRIRRHIQPTHPIPRQPSRAKAPRAIPRPIPLTLFHRGVKKHILCRRRTSQRFHRRNPAIRTALKLDSHKLEPRDGLAIPAPMVRNVHCRTVGIELAVDGRGVWL